MKIESEITKTSRYGDDAIEGFYTAIANGQARLAMTILADIIPIFVKKIDALEEALLAKDQDIHPPIKEVDLITVHETSVPEAVKPEAKAKPAAKEAEVKDNASV